MKSLLVLLLLMATPAAAFEVKSHDIADGALLSSQQVYPDCNGDNVSPQLVWSNPPAGTKSFAVTLYDPDAQPSGWWHWIVFNIPASATGVTRGAGTMPSLLPPGSVEGENDFGANAYGGACPPPGSGQHHYQFTVWALDSATVPLESGATGNDVRDYLKKHTVGQAMLTALYQR
ncbi:MAG TPA: YbhB/YbcL family Raf kinase inhibitor-like protein [Rhizomicrobium sp.]